MHSARINIAIISKDNSYQERTNGESYTSEMNEGKSLRIRKKDKANG